MLLIDPRERFSATASHYARWRPTYPAELRAFLVELLPPARAPERPRMLVDVGCGTGISTRFLAGPGLHVIGIEPNAEMRAEAKSTTPPGMAVEYRAGEASSTGLPPAAAELVTAAQAFHWFDLDPTLAEFRRILVPDGFCAAFWNIRDERSSPLLAEYQALLERSSREYRDVEKGIRTIDRLLASPRIAAARRAEFPHVQILDREGFFGRVDSSSYVAHGIPAESRAAFAAELDRLFDRHAEGGKVEFPYRTHAIAFHIEGTA